MNIWIVNVKVAIVKIVCVGYGTINNAIVHSKIPKSPRFVVFARHFIFLEMIGAIHHHIVTFTP